MVEMMESESRSNLSVDEEWISVFLEQNCLLIKDGVSAFFELFERLSSVGHV